MKLNQPVLICLVLCFASSIWASSAHVNPFVTNPKEEVKKLTRSEFVSPAKPVIAEPFQRKTENQDLNSLEHLLASHNERKRLQIENLLKRGNILDPGSVGKEPAQKCYACFGQTLEGCLNTKREKQCQGGQRCYTVHMVNRGSGQNTFVKGCISTAVCESDMCQRIRNTSKGAVSFCEADCCKGSLCNEKKAATSPRPLPTRQPATPRDGPKCYACQGKDLASCASHARLRQCKPGQRCADAYAVKNDGKTVYAKGCVGSELCNGGVCTRLNSTGQYSQCRSSCCEKNMCNVVPTLPTTKGPSTERPGTQVPSSATPKVGSKPTKLPTPRTLPPRPTPSSGYLCYNCSSQTAEQCSSILRVYRCDSDQVCFTGKATRKNGETMFGKGCMTQEQCKTSCNRLSVTTKECKVDCCRGDYCNAFPLPTKKPTTPVDTSCYRTLSQVLEVFKKVLETMDTVMKFKGIKETAPLYQRDIASLMGEIDTHAVYQAGKDEPEVRIAAKKLRSLHKRAGKVLKKINRFIGKTPSAYSDKNLVQL